MPEIPRANTHLTTVTIAERLADRLKGMESKALGTTMPALKLAPQECGVTAGPDERERRV